METANDFEQPGPAENLLGNVLQSRLNVVCHIGEDILFGSPLLPDDDDRFRAIPRRHEAASDDNEPPAQEQCKNQPPTPPPCGGPVGFQGLSGFVLMVLHSL